jgi:hypothetical protein
LALAAGGCGPSGLADGGYHGETLATFRGELKAADARGAIAMAILWAPSFEGETTSSPSGANNGPPSMMSGGANPGPGAVPPPNNGGGHGTQACPVGADAPDPVDHQLSFPRWVTESVRYQAQFPIDFQVPISSVPSPSVQVDLAPYGGQGRVSIGLLIAYEDTDGNGTFTPSSPGRIGDRLIATSARQEGATLIIFLDGTLPANNDAAILKVIPANTPQGFSVVDFTNGGASGPTQVALHTVQETTIELGTADPHAGYYDIIDCSTIDVTETTTPQNAPVPAGADVSCSSDRHSYRWTLRANAVCTEGATFGSGCFDPSGPAPAGWPCP